MQDQLSSFSLYAMLYWDVVQQGNSLEEFLRPVMKNQIKISD